MKKITFVAMTTLLCAAAQASSAAQPGSIRADTPIKAATATMNQACSTNGLVAADSDGSGLMLSCERGKFGPIGGAWAVKTIATPVHDNQIVKAPACVAGGVPGAVIAPADMAGQEIGDTTYSLRKATGGWRVSIFRVSASGHPQETGDIAATVTTACLL